MSERVQIPVSIKRYDDDLVSMTLGPATIEELAATMEALATEEGSRDFADQLARGIAAGSGD